MTSSPRSPAPPVDVYASDPCPCGGSEFTYLTHPDPVIYAQWWAHHAAHYEEATQP